MPTITLNKKRVLELLGKKIPDEILKERISYLGTDLEEIDKEKIVVEIFPNRPDLLSEEGFSRALKTFLGIEKGMKKYSSSKSNYLVEVDESLKEIRPNTACVVVKNVKLNQEKLENIISIQEKLHVTYGRNRKRCAIGIYPLDIIKFPIKYTALKPEEIKFKPLGSEKIMTGQQILKEHKTGKDYGWLLEKHKKYPVFIDSNNEILSMPPIINSQKTGKVETTTKDLFIECSGTDFKVLSKAINMLSCVFSDMGGELFEVKIKHKNKTHITPELDSEEIKLDFEYVNKYLGTSIKKGEIISLLEKMGFEANSQGNVKIPPYRTDILHQIDLVEDIAIAYGFENIQEDNQRPFTVGKESKIEKLKRKVREIFIGMENIEVFSFSLINKEEQKELGFEKIVSIRNSLSSEYDSLRMSLIPSILKIYKNNKHYEYPQKIFEIGTTFHYNEQKETNVEERNNLCLASCGENVSFTNAKQQLDVLASSLNFDYSLERIKNKLFVEGRSAEIKINNLTVGIIGEINPAILNYYSLEYPVCVFELDLDVLLKVVFSEK